MRKSVNKNRLLEEIFKSIDAEYERIKQDSQNYNELYSIVKVIMDTMKTQSVSTVLLSH